MGITVILLHKDGLVQRTLTADGMLMKVSVAVTLAAMIFIAGPHSGAGFNPAVAIGLRVLCTTRTPATDPNYAKCTEYTWLYVGATLAGGAVAGLLANLHRVVGKAFTEIGHDPVKLTRGITPEERAKEIL